MLDRGCEVFVKWHESGNVGFEAFGPVVFGGSGSPDEVVRAVLCLCEGRSDDQVKAYFSQVLVALVQEVGKGVSEDVWSLLVARGVVPS